MCIRDSYFVNDAFLADGTLMTEIEKLRDKPTVIIQGRYDMVCPIVTADAISRAWPEAEYVIVADASHSAMEAGIRAALVRATESMKTRIR